jgi:hypothetical protein
MQGWSRPGLPGAAALLLLACSGLGSGPAAMAATSGTAAADSVTSAAAADADSLSGDHWLSTAGDASTALPDSLAAALDSLGAVADSLGASPTPAGQSGLAAAMAALQGGHGGELPPSGGQPAIVSWTREPKAGLRAQVRKVEYYGSLDNNMTLTRQAKVSQSLAYSNEEYRKQNKTVDRRDASLLYSAGETLPVKGQLRMNWNWSEDRTVNSTGNVNLIKRDFKQAALSVSKDGLHTGPVSHGVFLSGSVDANKGENQRQRSDYTEADLAGAFRSKYKPLTGVALATSLYQQRSDGERALGEVTSPSSANQDTLAGGLYYRRGAWQGTITAKQASFNKRYLDWRRNTNGIIDTLRANIPPGESKVVEELEEKDAVSLQWNNQLRWGRLGLSSLLARDTEDQAYRYSGVGRKERFDDRLQLDLSFRYSGEDSLKLGYKYEYKWDDQTYRGQSTPRGRQIQKKRSLDLSVIQGVFPHSDLTVNWGVALTQDTAERGFNDNDRDYLDTGASARLVSSWPGTFQTSMVFSYKHVEDISLRASRSASNNNRDTYEIVPGYSWPLAPWLDLRQDFRISIQFTDYVFSDLPSITREDDYNKRGNLNTRVTLRPSERLELTVSHDYSAKFNATRTSTDATGNNYYRRDQEQRISTIDFELSYKASEWLKLEGASYRTKDLKDVFGVTVRSTDTRSGEIWLGGVINKTWGQSKERVLAAAVRRYQAFGPNVQESNARYWDADASFTWKF